MLHRDALHLKNVSGANGFPTFPPPRLSRLVLFFRPVLTVISLVGVVLYVALMRPPYPAIGTVSRPLCFAFTIAFSLGLRLLFFHRITPPPSLPFLHNARIQSPRPRDSFFYRLQALGCLDFAPNPFGFTRLDSSSSLTSVPRVSLILSFCWVSLLFWFFLFLSNEKIWPTKRPSDGFPRPP